MPTRRRRPIAADDLYRFRFVSDPQVSPDGTQVAYVVSWVDPNDQTRYRSQLMLVAADGAGVPRALTSGRHRDSTPRWAPNGSSLAFVSDRDGERPQIFVLPLDGGEPRQLTTLKRGAGAPVWSPDAHRIAFAANVDDEAIASQEGQSDEKGKAPRLKLVTRVRHKGDGEGFFQSMRRHLFVVGLDGQAPGQVTDGDWFDSEPAWSPDGRLLAFISSREADRDLTILADVWVVPSTGGRARRVTQHAGEVASPAFSPDGKSIAYYGHEQGWTYGAGTQLMCVAVDGGPSRSVSGGLDEEMGNVALSDLRDPFAAKPPQWLADGQALLTLVSRFGRVSVVRFGLDGAEPQAVVDGERELASFSVARDGRTIAYAWSDPTRPYDVWVCSDGQERQLTHENDALLDTLEISPVEEFSVTSTDGTTVQGWLMRPAAATRSTPAPLILEVHGGPEAMYGWSFMHEFQVLAARGFGVLYTNPRGSRGYGEAFTGRIYAEWGGQDADDCLAAVEAASRLPWVDGQRLGVTGGSYGGFMTAWLVGHTNRFRAAVATRGCYNFVSFYGTSDIGPPFSDYIFGGPVYEKEALYRERSPLTYAPQMRTPLLLIHNENDLRCPMEQAEQLFVQLRRIGKVETDLVRFPEESHNLSRSGRPDRRVERLGRIAGWFERHLADPAPQAPAKRAAAKKR